MPADSSTASPRSSLIARALSTLIWGGSLLLGLLVFWPGGPPAQWLSTQLFLAHALAFPTIAAGCMVLLLGGFLSLLLLPRRRRRRECARPLAFLVPLSLSLCASVVLLVAPVPGTTSLETQPVPESAPTPESVRVVTYNSLDTFSRADLRQLVDKIDPDIVVLPEAAPHRVRELVRGTGFDVFAPQDRGYVVGPSSQIAPTTLLVHNRLPRYRNEPATPTTFGSVMLVPEDPRYPSILAIHTAPPVPGYMAAWRADLHRLFQAHDRSSNQNTIMVGDFNATLRHGPVAARTHLADAAERCGIAGTGTWPAGNPGWLRTPIDHVFLPRVWTVRKCSVFELGDGDHLALYTELQPATGTDPR